MEIPKFHETFVPILSILSSGDTIHTRDLYQKDIEKYYQSLSQDQQLND
ncbi:MAG TPA: hypothetical protein PLS73_13815 [Saprospiraceae bacterium]|nr:hypothetical protein [Saprospiraceae bacterium]